MTVGAGFQGKGGAVLLYASKDLAHWDYLHPLYTAAPFEQHDSAPASRYDSVGSGDMWECPDFFPLGQKHVLLVSTEGRVHYFVGTYSNRRFQAESARFDRWLRTALRVEDFRGSPGPKNPLGMGQGRRGPMPLRTRRAGPGQYPCPASCPLTQTARCAWSRSGICPAARPSSSNRRRGSFRHASRFPHSRELAGNPVGN